MHAFSRLCAAAAVCAMAMSAASLRAADADPASGPMAPPSTAPPTDYSAAERLLFMTDQLANVKPPTTLHYNYHKSGALEAGFDDTVAIALAAQADGTCCTSHGDFFTGTRAVKVPDVEGAHGNPVILYFLERDIADMQRLTKGQPNYFRKRIRMAVYNGATVKDVSLKFAGKSVAGKEVSVEPYLDDPARSRYDRFARKRYAFVLSDAVPGGVYSIRTVMSAEASDAPPMIVEELVIDGAEAKSAKAKAPVKP